MSGRLSVFEFKSFRRAARATDGAATRGKGFSRRTVAKGSFLAQTASTANEAAILRTAIVAGEPAPFIASPRPKVAPETDAAPENGRSQAQAVSPKASLAGETGEVS